MSSNNHDAEAEINLLPKHTQFAATSLESDDANDPVAHYYDLSAEDVSVVDEKRLEEQPAGLSRSKRGLQKPFLLWVFFFALIIFSFLAYFLLPFTMNQTPTFHPVFGDCGKTPDEARGKGCIYDPLAVTWVRPECYYPELIEEFIDMEPVRFYNDKALSKESLVPIEEVIPGEREQVWAPHKFHSVICSTSDLA
jgi:hypothetical protein